MKKRTFNQIMESKKLYKKHADKYKADNYPESRSKRFLIYTSLIAKNIAYAGKR